MPLKTHTDEAPQLNLTSMIDVVFLLIIFFMVGAKFSEMERAIGLEIPRVADAGALSAAPSKRVVNVYQDGHVTLDGEVADLDQIVSRLSDARRQYADLGVLIRGDARVPFEYVAQALNACKQAGIGELGISVRIETEARRPQ